jgi:hypothetical protein
VTAADDAALASAKGKMNAFAVVGARASLQVAGGGGRCPTSFLLHGWRVFATSHTLDRRCLGAKIFGNSLFFNIRTPRGRGGGFPLIKL